VLTSLYRHFFSSRKYILSLHSCRSAARPFHRYCATLTLCSSSLIGSFSENKTVKKHCYNKISESENGSYISPKA
jgi:hypothetical protein